MILDGVVRTVPQAEGLQRVLQELGRPLDAVLVLEVPDESWSSASAPAPCATAARRPTRELRPGRRARSAGDGWCAARTTSPRPIRNRLAVYQRQTAPVIDWYRNDGVRLRFVDGVGSLDDVLARIRESLAP